MFLAITPGARNQLNFSILLLALSSRAVNNTGKKYWQYQYQYLLIKVLAIPIPILFLKSIAIPIPILYQYFSISKFVFNPIKCMLTVSISRLIQFRQHTSTCSLMRPTLYINAHTTNDTGTFSCVGYYNIAVLKCPTIIVIFLSNSQVKRRDGSLWFVLGLVSSLDNISAAKA